jgi:hypothetical protein
MDPLLKARVSFRWLYRPTFGCCVALVLFFVYALSFGPALKFSGREPGSRLMLPRWMYVTYAPLFAVKARLPSAVDGAYEHYLDFWYPQPVYSDRHE